MGGDLISSIIGLVLSLCDCAFWILVIGGGLWFFVFRKKGDADPITAAANDVNQALDKASNAFDTHEEEDEVATVVAPQPSAVAAAPKPARPPRTAGATIIAFDDDDLLDD